MMPPFSRTPDAQFAQLPGYAFEPHYIERDGLRMHYVDEGPRDGRPVLMVHGEPTWSYLYRGIIAPMAAAGYRCIAPDHIGFGRSDKVTDDDWYVIERHCEGLRHLIETLDLKHAVLVCQDWGGPIGLRQAVDQADRFAALVILNTWLHHDGYEYTSGIRGWRAASQDPDVFGGDMPTGRIVGMTLRRPGHDLDAVRAAYDAPFTDAASKAGARRFPWCLPFVQPVHGNAADQQRCFEALKSWSRPAHFIFGDSDQVFTWEWAQQWSSMIASSTLDRIEGVGHFVQEDAPAELAEIIMRRLDEDSL
jgi:haloalkane dehalogenase